MKITVITGLSGSGKSTAIHAFEDRGMFCIDNIPIVLLPDLVKLVAESRQEVDGIVVGIDAREGHFLTDFKRTNQILLSAGHELQVIYLEARDEVLIRRFSETRRKHPLGGKDVISALAREREMLEELREAANDRIDTSSMNVHQLKQHVINHAQTIESASHMSVTLLSFGFKYGVPLEADLVYDLRFLPNPYFEESLRQMTGQDEEVRSYVMAFKEANIMLEKIQDLLQFLLPEYEKEGKAYLTVALGCTGGRHRSTTFAYMLDKFLQTEMPEYKTFIRHRDIEKG